MDDAPLFAKEKQQRHHYHHHRSSHTTTLATTSSLTAVLREIGSSLVGRLRQ
jgi:hypothetical protein